MNKPKLDLDFRNDPSAPASLHTLTGMTLGVLVRYLPRRRINPLEIRSITFGAVKSPRPQKIGLATIIATKLNVIVHFSHRGIPVTTYPNTRVATQADYDRRREAGETVETEEPLDDETED